MSGTFVVNIDVSDLRRRSGQWASFHKIFGGGIDEAIETRIGPKILEDLREKTPKSGRDSPGGPAYTKWRMKRISSFSSGDGRVDFINTAGYLHIVSGGRRAGPIEVDPPIWMKFYWERTGRIEYRRRVFHPGMEPNPFVEDVVSGRVGFILQEIAYSVRISVARTFGA